MTPETENSAVQARLIVLAEALHAVVAILAMLVGALIGLAIGCIIAGTWLGFDVGQWPPAIGLAALVVGLVTSATSLQEHRVRQLAADHARSSADRSAISSASQHFPTCGVCGEAEVEDAGDHADTFGHWPWATVGDRPSE